MGITSTAGVFASSGILAATSAPATGGVSIPIIIIGATTIVAIVALCNGYDIDGDRKKGN